MGSMLTRPAPLTTTGVGSLPFTRPGEAARHAVHAYELPFCPQLPRAYGLMAAHAAASERDLAGALHVAATALRGEPIPPRHPGGSRAAPQLKNARGFSSII